MFKYEYLWVQLQNLDGIIPPLVHIQQQVAIRIEFLITEATSIEIFHYSSPLRQPLFKMARFQKWLLLMLLATPIRSNEAEGKFAKS